MKESIFIVIPTIRNLDFFKDWKEQFRNCTIVVCEDQPHKTIKIPKIGKQILHYSWKEIDEDLGKDSWIIPRRVSAIRSYGFLQAYKLGADIIMTIDDDCYPVSNHNFVEDHTRNLTLSSPKNWINTNPDVRHMYTRGMPYLNRNEQPVMLSHGIWTNVLDHDAPTHLQQLNFKASFAENFLYFIPNGTYFPMCSMNMAFRREITPLMYFPLMGEDNQGNKWGYDRFDDIWAGIFAKKIMDHLGYGVVNGSPMVEHRKASDPFKNLQKEARGIHANEEFWMNVSQVTLTKSSIQECYDELLDKTEFPKSIYFTNLIKASYIWNKLFPFS